MKKTLFIVLSAFSLIPFSNAFAFEFIFKNNTAAVAHLDFPVDRSACNISPGLDSDGNVGFYTSTKVNCKTGNVFKFAQYSVGSILKDVPKCYLNVDAKGNISLDPASKFCKVSGNTATLEWDAPNINYATVSQTVLTLSEKFVAKKPAPQTNLLPNVMPMNQTKLDEEIQADDWQLQFSYDASRFPLFAGAFCLAHPSDKLCAKDFLTKFMSTIQNSDELSKQGKINPDGYWTYGANDGKPVGHSGYVVKPALTGPLAVAEAGVNGLQSEYLGKLVSELSTYDISQHTPITAEGQGYPNSSDPYFNSSLNLLSQALLVGNGSLNLKDNKGSGYLSFSQFKSNYAVWNTKAFIADFGVTDENGKNYNGSRVIFSVDTAPHTRADNWENAGASPTVSEGMAYGLLIAYAANDQVTFDKLLNFVLFTSRVHGCAAMNKDQTACTVKTNYLMPWMVDQTGRPFHYTVAGEYFTNGSATDADINIIWALGLASERWKAPSKELMGGDNYAEIAKKMIKEMAFFDFNEGVTFFGEGSYTVYSPGSQWGDAGKNVIYPGYFAPEALGWMDKLKQ